ncbi:CHASE3 domain-containing protein [Polyangium jinanense]|uniref:CHASE3 domain-containing protein n=1 Tax=Polyangium jinanense TaxID=2829994 RepID=A0A9X4AQR0_9BACT|nr:CHASE3 domain-containing protein [Polyangium jinanense]MDC3952998.1 CHASE3 domain-containing protein [Polyangium jinanense]MDC3980616.1 CHASE3 domain-containing protein [Polyangium jinanense]
MRKSWTVGQQIAAGFLLPLLILIALGAFSYRSTQRLLATSEAVTHAHEEMTGLSSFLAALDETETGKRGFVITGREEFLQPYHTGKKGVGIELRQLEELFGDDSDQRVRVKQLRPLVEERLREIDETIDTRRTQGFDAAVKIVIEGNGAKVMDRIRHVVAELKTHEQRLLTERSTDAKQAAAWLSQILIFGTLAAVLIVASIAVFLTRGLGARIGAAVQHIRSAAAELEAAATQQVRGAKGQVSAATEVSTTVRELVTTSRQISESAQRVTQVASETAMAAKGGNHTVEGAQEAIETVRRQVDQIVAHMLDLGRKSQEIGGILDIVSELSEQTNILAINATIEAVSAGETGRRFGVVAGEIRKLADRVGGSAKEIRRLIEEIRAAANTTVMATEDGAKAVEAGTRRFGEVAQSFRRIVEYVGSTAEASREIELSTKQQTSAMEQVASAIADVAQTARESESGSSQTLNTASQLSGLSGDLVRLIRQEEQAA